MKNIIFAIDELLKKPLFSFFTVIQIIISFILIFIAISNTNSVDDKIDLVNKIFKGKNYYVLDVSDMKTLENESIEKLNKFDDYIRNNQNINLYSVNDESVFIAKDNLPNYFNTNFDSININNQNFERVMLLFVNNKYLENIGMDFLEGNIDDTEEGYDSVVLGYNYKEYFNINDVIPYSYVVVNGERKVHYFKVRGFVSKDNMVCIGGDFNNLINTNNYIITIDNGHWIDNKDASEMIKKIQTFNTLKGSFYDITYDDKVVEEVNEFSKDLGLNYKLKSQKQKINEINEEIMPGIIAIKSLSCIILFFTSISIIMVMLNTIIDNIKQYAINMLVGATLKDIIMRVFFEIAILFLISLGSSMFIIFKFFKNNIAVVINAKNILELCFIGVVICICISAFPMLKIRKISINNMIRGGDNL